MSGEGKQVSNSSNNDFKVTEEENELKQLRDYVLELEETIEKEDEKNTSLNEVIIEQRNVIETLQNKKDSEIEKIMTKTKKVSVLEQRILYERR